MTSQNIMTSEETSTKQTWKKMMMKATQGEDSELEEERKGADAFRSLVSQLAENTAMHGLPNASKAKTKQQKIFWICVLVFGVVMISYHLTAALIKFFDRPVTTTLTVVPSPSQNFPAVTICNTNAIRKKAMEESSNSAMNSLNTMISDAHSGEMTKMGSQMEDVSASMALMDRMVEVQRSMANASNSSTASMNASDVMNMMTSGMGFDAMTSMSKMMGEMNMSAMTGDDVMKMMNTTAIQMMNENMNGWDNMDETCYTGRSEQMKMFFEYQQMVSQMSREERQSSGHQLKDMLLDCSWGGTCCSPENFTGFLNSMHGNCYTFNGNNKRPLVVNREGPMFGLSLELYIEQDEYTEMLSDSAGILLTIHNQTVMPFPEDVGLSIKPGTKTFIGIKKGEVRLLDKPHGDCRQLTGVENRRRNGFVDEIPTIEYSSDACMKTCYQRSLIKQCGCGDNTYPMNASNDAFLDVTKNQQIRPCNITNTKDANCWRGVDLQHAENTLGCDCPPACYRNHYETQMTTGEWPTIPNEEYTLNKVQLSARDMMTKMRGRNKKEDQLAEMRRNVLKVQVFYQSLDTIVTETEASYDETALLSDIGGQVSLWLGLSVVTAFEILEFCGNILRFSAKKCCRRSKDGRSRTVSPTDVQLSNSTTNLWTSGKQ